jgi:hypothetical protein
LPDETSSVDVALLSEIVNALNRLDADSRLRMLRSLATLYGIPDSPASVAGAVQSPSQNGEIRPSFAEDRSVPPKEFVWQKQPKTAIERVVCLAYYLTHYRGLQYVKTADITELNMEAAQLKFSNPAMMVAEATRAGYLAPAGGQNKQLTVVGEQFVRLLPDRQAAYEAIKGMKPKRSRRKAANQKEEPQNA